MLVVETAVMVDRDRVDMSVVFPHCGINSAFHIPSHIFELAPSTSRARWVRVRPHPQHCSVVGISGAVPCPWGRAFLSKGRFGNIRFCYGCSTRITAFRDRLTTLLLMPSPVCPLCSVGYSEPLLLLQLRAFFTRNFVSHPPPP